MKLPQDDAIASAILETVRLPLLALDAELRVETVNDAFLTQFRVSREETVGRLIYALGNGQWDIPELRRLLGEILPEKSAVSDYRVEHRFERIGRRIMRLSARRIARPDDPDLILIAISDDTERESLRNELIGRIELADKLIDSVREGLLILDPDLRVHSASGSFYETFGVQPEDTVGCLVYELGNGQWDIPDLRRLLEDVLPRQSSFDDYEVAHSFEDIGERVMLLNGRRLDHQDLILLAIRDITDSLYSKARLQEVTRVANVGLFEIDLRAGTTYWSPEMRNILGYPQDAPSTPVGVVPDFIHPDDRADVTRATERLFDLDRNGEIFNEHRIVRPDGEVRWVQFHGRTEFDEIDGQRQPVHLRGVILDVTERKVAEEKLRESEAQKAFLLELSDALRPAADPADITGIATRLIGERLNATRAYYVTWPPGEDYGEVSPDYAAPGVPSLAGRYPVDVFRSAYDNLARGDTWIVKNAATAVDFDEAERDHYLDLDVAAWVDIPLVKGGELQAALCVVQDSPRDWTADEVALIEDVAERCWAAVERSRSEAALRKTTASLRESRQRQQLAADAAGLGVWEWFVGEDRAIWEDTRTHEIFGLSPDRAPLNYEELARDHLHPDDRAHLEHQLEEGWRTGWYRAACRITRASDRQLRWIEFCGHCERDAHGQPARIIGVVADITEKRHAEEHQNMLMAELDHRVKNILAVVQSIARQSLGRSQSVGPEAADQLVGRLRALAQSHALLAGGRWEGARFADIVETAVSPYRGGRADRIVANGADVKLTPKAAQTLNLALHELVTNAAKYGALSRDTGHVSAEWQLTDSRDDPHLVFTWLERGGPEIGGPPSRKGFGSRLIEQALTAELGGEVTLDFARDGLRVVIDLPLEGLRVRASRPTRPLRRSITAAAGDPAVLKGMTVLVVEDEYLVAQETADSLQSAGCSVTGPISTMREALRAAASDDIDAAVLDVNLNGELVWPAAHALRARGIPLIFTSGYSDSLETPQDLLEAVRIEKPVNPEMLLSTLAAVVGDGGDHRSA